MGTPETLLWDETTVEVIRAHEIVYWGGEHDENLCHEDMIDAVVEILDDMEELPDTLDIWGYKRMAIDNQSTASEVVEGILENMDNEYGSYDQDPTRPTPAMLEAAEKLLDVVRKEYVPWVCVAVLICRIPDVKEWVKRNYPEWE